jgi:hypothetical protein
MTIKLMGAARHGPLAAQASSAQLARRLPVRAVAPDSCRPAGETAAPKTARHSKRANLLLLLPLLLLLLLFWPPACLRARARSSFGQRKIIISAGQQRRRRRRRHHHQQIQFAALGAITPPKRPGRPAGACESGK